MDTSSVGQADGKYVEYSMSQADAKSSEFSVDKADVEIIEYIFLKKISHFLFYTIFVCNLLFLLSTISDFIKVLDKLYQGRLKPRTSQQPNNWTELTTIRPDKFFNHITIIIILIHTITIIIIIITINII